jgi:DNA topoisomerase-1
LIRRILIELNEMEEKKMGTVEDKVKFYNDANRQVAILCNHQKTVSKNFNEQVEKMQDKLKEKLAEQKALSDHLTFLQTGKKVKKEKGEKAEINKKMPQTIEQAQKAIERVGKTVNSLENKLRSKVNSNSNYGYRKKIRKLHWEQARSTIWIQEYLCHGAKIRKYQSRRYSQRH